MEGDVIKIPMPAAFDNTVHMSPHIGAVLMLPIDMSTQELRKIMLCCLYSAVQPS